MIEKKGLPPLTGLRVTEAAGLALVLLWLPGCRLQRLMCVVLGIWRQFKITQCMRRWRWAAPMCASAPPSLARGEYPAKQ